MKVLTIYRENDGGGCFRRLLMAIEAMVEAGCEVHYVSTGQFPLNSGNVHFHRLPSLFRKRTVFYGLLFVLTAYVAYLHLMYRFRSVVVFSPIYAFACLPVRALFGIRLITFLRGDWIGEIAFEAESPCVRRLCSFIEKTSLKYSDVVCAVTRDLKDRVEARYGIKNVRVLPNNIDVEVFYPRNSRGAILKELTVDEDSFVIGYVGPFLPIKRVDVLIRAFAKVTGKSMLLIVGSGRLEAALKAIAAESNIEDRVIFTGWRRDIPEVLSSLDLLVLPSEYEGCPGVLLEALGCGTLSIGSGVGGIREILYHDDLLFECLNVEKLARKLQRIISDKAFYNRLSSLFLGRKPQFVFDWKRKVVEIMNPSRHERQ